MKVRLCASLILAIFGAPLAALRGADATAPALPNGLYAEITTPRGTLTAELFFTQAPLTTASFVGLDGEESRGGAYHSECSSVRARVRLLARAFALVRGRAGAGAGATVRRVCSRARSHRGRARTP